MEILQQLCEAVPEFWPNHWVPHYDNVPAHKVLSSSFKPKNRLLKWNTHSITLILLQMISGCFQK
jgi:hypothetical protein